MQKGRVTRPLISLIVPVWGDDDLAAALVNRLPSSPDLLEWVVAAVDPSATLRELEHRGDIRLVPCVNPSRGRQLNAGAAEAHGLLLCFHHADSELLPEHVSALVKVAADEAVGGGAFHRKFDDRHGWMMRWEAAARGLCSVAGPLFGDQSIFVRADVFKRLGGFADIPLMEDVEFSSRLRHLTRIKLLYPPLRSSPRRFQSLGNWRSTLLNILFIALFYLGISPNILHRWYYQARRKSGSADRDTIRDTKK
jgi:glycosyltransferase involved in cell wall biosynthesis